MSEIPKEVAIIDAGHWGIKARKGDKTIVFKHALWPLSHSEYEDIVAKSGAELSEDYLVINGQPFAFGETAERHGVFKTRVGADRYTSDYFGILVAATLWRLSKKSGTLAVYAAHPTGDVRYRKELAKSVFGEWRVQHGDETRVYCVAYVNSFEECVGALYNQILTADGQHIANKELRVGDVLGVDLGGGTLDFQSMLDGKVTQTLSISLNIGVRQIEDDFEYQLRANNAAFFRRTRHIAPSMLREAMDSGIFNGGGKQIPCALEARSAKNKLLNQFKDAYSTRAGGPANWRHIMLAGGGCGRFYDDLLPILEHDSVHTATKDLADIHLGTISGGQKLWNLNIAMEWFS